MECLVKTQHSNNHKPQSLGEEIGNAITHGIGFLVSIVLMILLILKSDTEIKLLSAIIYGISMMLLYLMSCLYHSFKNGTVVKRVFRRFDHISIFFLIGGTFAPILLVFVNNTYSWIFFYIQWVLIILGVVFKSIWPTKFLPVTTILYLLLGWSGLIFIPNMIENSMPLFFYILFGGISYSIGVVFYAILKFKFHHFIWHFFVLLGSILQFIGIYLYIFS